MRAKIHDPKMVEMSELNSLAEAILVPVICTAPVKASQDLTTNVAASAFLTGGRP